MDNLTNSMKDIKLLINNAVDSEENCTSKLETYRKYIKSMNELFICLNKDLENYSNANESKVLKIVNQKHMTMLKLAQSSIARSIKQLEEVTPIQQSIRSKSVFQRNLYTTPPEYASLPSKKSIDILIAEKPLNPIDSAKFNLQNMINNTKMLLQSERLSSIQRSSIQLQLNRMIEETLSIARKKESDICKIRTNDLEQLQNKIENDIHYFKIFNNEIELSRLYRSSLLFYYQILKGSKWYEIVQLNRCPEEACLSFIMKMNDHHPIVVYIDNIIESLIKNKIENENLDNVLTEIKKFLLDVEQLSKVCCLIINVNSIERSYNSHAALLTLLYEYIFIKPCLVTFFYDYFFVSSEANMKQYNENVKLISEGHDDSILLPEKFKRYPEIKEIIDLKIEKFGNLRNLYNPLNRMTKLCELIQSMMLSINEKNPNIEIGADELVPILSYMMIKFGSPEIFLHIKYLELLIPNDNMMGLEGYILVSVCCAMTFCVSEKFKSYLCENNI